MYDDLIQRLRRYSENCVAYKLDADFASAVQEAADAIEKLSNEVDWWKAEAKDWYLAFMDLLPTRWIPVTERLPEADEWVLCWCVSKTQEALRWENNEWYHDPKHVYFSDFVTHWMPLPEPPKEET